MPTQTEVADKDEERKKKMTKTGPQASPGLEDRPDVDDDADETESQIQEDRGSPEPSQAGGKGPRIPIIGTAAGDAEDDGDEAAPRQSAAGNDSGGEGRTFRSKEKDFRKADATRKKSNRR